MQTQLKTNQFVTISHILLIAVYSILSILKFNVSSHLSIVTFYRVLTAWTFFGGLADLFITCMIWFVFDDKATPVVFRHGEHSYSVMNIINEEAYLTGEAEIEEEEEEEMSARHSSVHRRDTLISDRMIAQFFNNEVEGPDRDWSEPYEFEDQMEDEADEPQ